MLHFYRFIIILESLAMSEHYYEPQLPQTLQIQIANFIISIQLYAKLEGT